MENYEIKLMVEVTNKLDEYLKKGYILKTGNSSMGYLSLVEIFNPENPKTFIRIYVKESFGYEKPEGFEVPKYNYILNFFELRVVELEYNQTFERGEVPVEVIRFYLVGNKFLTKDGKLSNEYNNKTIQRYKNKPGKNNHVFNPAKSLNIRGFKSLNPKDVEITRFYKSPYNRHNYYEIKNLKNGKIIKKYI